MLMGRGVGPGSDGSAALWPSSSLGLACATCDSERSLSIPLLTVQWLSGLDLSVVLVVILEFVSGSRRTRVPWCGGRICVW